MCANVVCARMDMDLLLKRLERDALDLCVEKPTQPTTVTRTTLSDVGRNGPCRGRRCSFCLRIVHREEPFSIHGQSQTTAV